MKKLLSLVLVMATLFAIAAITTNAAEVDTAQTGATYYVSSKPFESITVANANVIGFLGDLDSDKDISIMDATKIQLAIAKKTTLNSAQTLLADVDRDNQISVMDATGIQRYIAKLSAGSAKVAHTLYTMTIMPTTDTVYGQIVNYVKAHTVYNAKYKFYSLDHYGSSSFTSIIYYPEDQRLVISYNTGTMDTTFNSVYLSVPKEKTEYEYASYMVSKTVKNKMDYDAFGEAKQVKSTDTKLKLTNYLFESETGKTFAKSESDIQANITVAMDSVKTMLGKNISGNIYTLFA